MVAMLMRRDLDIGAGRNEERHRAKGEFQTLLSTSRRRAKRGEGRNWSLISRAGAFSCTPTPSEEGRDVDSSLSARLPLE